MNSDALFLDRRERCTDETLWRGPDGQMDSVVTSHYRATQVGRYILDRGGNAVDTAIGVSCALGVVEPSGSGLGGMSMVLVHLPKSGTFFFEGGCRAPFAATPEHLTGVNRKFGYPAIAVPMNPGVLHHLHTSYGRLSLQTILEKVISYCNEGVPITPFQQNLRKEYIKGIRRGNAASVLLGKDGGVPAVGEMIPNIALAHTFSRMSQYGFSEFYLGETGEILVGDMTSHGGFITEEDFRFLPVPQLIPPLDITIGRYRVKTTPPPAGGFTLAQMLLLFEKTAPQDFSPDKPESYSLMAEIIRSCRKDRRRNRLMSIDHGVWKDSKFLGKKYIEKRSRELKMKLHTGETTHFNVVDSTGMVVAMTQSIERSFGSKIMTPDLGFLYNGFMQGFKIEAKRHPHYLRPGAVSRSNAAPTIIFENNAVRYIIGSTGSERMVSGIFQVLVRLQAGQTPFQAVSAPRIHCNPEGELFGEFGRMAPEIVDRLMMHGFTLIPYSDDWSFSSGGLNLTVIDDDGTAYGVSDPRRDGCAL